MLPPLKRASWVRIPAPLPVLLGHNSVGRVPDSESGCRRFEPFCPCQIVHHGRFIVSAIAVKKSTPSEILMRHGFPFTEQGIEDALDHVQCYYELYEHYVCDMPYGTAKARTGCPMNFISEK